MLETVMDIATKEGERSLKRYLRRCQKARENIRTMLREGAPEASAGEAMMAEDCRLARIESYILHAISDLPEDRTLRLQALDEHVQSVKTLSNSETDPVAPWLNQSCGDRSH